MSKQFEGHNPEVPQEEKDAVTLIKKVVQQLAYLETKIDLLLAQSKNRPSFQDKNFSKPYRPYGGSQGYQGNRDNRNRDRGFEKRSYYDKNKGREERGFQEPRSFDQGQRRENSHFDPKKKPFYSKHKGRGR